MHHLVFAKHLIIKKSGMYKITFRFFITFNIDMIMITKNRRAATVFVKSLTNSNVMTIVVWI